VDYHDALVPGLALRVTETGHRSFVVITRFGNAKNPTRRLLGIYGRMTLDQARQEARQRFALIGRGVDPKIEAARQRAEEERRQIVTFAAVATQFIERHVSGLAKAQDARHSIETEFVKRWGPRPIADIRAEECASAIRAIVARGSPYQAHNALGYLRRLFSWAANTGEFGAVVSPVAGLRPKDLIGVREARKHVLTDGELRTVWVAAGGMGYVFGPLIRMMILTGQREREVAEASWREIDLGKRLWTIPARRMKGGVSHEVPLCGDVAALLRALPRFNAGDFVFSTTSGVKPVNGFSRAKVRMDRLSGMTGWKFHDLRRTMRTHLSALPIQDNVRELVIAHAQSGLHRVYDQHSYQDEKRECLGLWEARLRGIISRGADV
jgi:integrase